MSALTDLQGDFLNYLLRGDERLRARVRGTSKVDAETRLGIYFDAYRLRLLEALDANFPALHRYLGDADFEQLALSYLTRHPPAHFSIRYFGDRLPEHLTSEAYRDRPYLSELATFEWALAAAFDAADASVARLEDMAHVPPPAWPGMRLRLHPSVQRLDLRWNVPVIWKAVSAELEGQPGSDGCRGETSNTPATDRPATEAHALRPDVPAPQSGEYPQPWVVWRQDLTNYFRSLSVDEAWALDAVLRGEDFAAVCEGLCEWIEAQYVAAHAAGLVKHWISDGLVSAIETG